MESSGLQAFLILAGIPLGLAALVLLAVYVPHSARSSRSRYRPGGAWLHDPVWLESSAAGAQSDAGGSAGGGGSAKGPLPPGSAAELEERTASEAGVPGPGLTRARARRVAARSAGRGGTAAVAPEHPGGARGTW